MGVDERHEYGPTLDLLLSLAAFLWVVAIAFYGFGDLLTTVAGLQVSDVKEVGMLAGPVIEYGVSALVALKVAVFLLCGVIWRFTPEPYRIGVPLGLAALGVVVTSWNVAVLVVRFA